MLPIESELTQALYDGDLSRVKALVESGADLRYRYEGYDALIDAVHGRDVLVDPGLINMLRWLIDRGVELNTVTRHDESALRVLSRIGRFDAVRLLLEAGADEAQLTWSPLIKAVALGTLEDVHALLGQPTELEARDFWSRTAWLVALQLADVEKAKLLRLHGVDPRALGRCGQPPLFYAIDSRHAPMLEWLLSLSEFDVEQTDEFGTTALIHAVEVDALELVNLLLGAGADLARVYNGGTALSSGQTLPIVTTLLGAGADPKRLSTRGRRLLIGLPAEPELTALDSVTQPEFLRARTRRYGSTNPEVMNEPFWLAMIRSGVSGYEASTKLSGASSFGGPPTWCAYRFGQSLTRLADGRVITVNHRDASVARERSADSLMVTPAASVLDQGRAPSPRLPCCSSSRC